MRRVCFVFAVLALAAAPARADDESPESLYRAGRVLWRYGMFDQAISVFERIADDHPDADVAEWAVELLLDSLNRARRYDALVARVDALLARPAFLRDKPDLAERLRIIRRQAHRKDAERAERAGDYERCGEIYAALFDADPRADHGDELLYNAAHCYRAAGAVGVAIGLRQRLIDRFPKSALAMKAWVWLAVDYGQLADYENAAERLEGYARRYAGEKDAPEALSNAFLYRSALGDVKRAAADVELFVKQYGKKRKREAADALFALAGLYRGRDEAAMAGVLERYLKQYGAAGGRDRRVIAAVELGRIEWEAACKRAELGLCKRKRNARRARRAAAHFERALSWSRGDVSDAMRDAVAQARLHLADAQLEAALRDPKAPADDVEDAYREVVAVGSARWSVAALARRGQLLEARGDAAAIDQYAACLAAASDAAVDGEYAQLCDERVAAERPEDASPAERHAPPTARPAILSRPRLER